jgi:hypothetical protein
MTVCILFLFFLANKASQVPKAGGPLNNGGSKDDDLRKSARIDENAGDLRKTARNNERDENSPGINDILSGIDGNCIYFATLYCTNQRYLTLID